MALPELSAEQRRQALAKAGEARRTRAEIKELLRTGSLTLGEVLERADGDEIVAGTKVAALLQSLPGLGKVKAKRTMEELGIAENRTIRGLGSNQRAQLLERFT
ncbi:MAG: integration host factor [Actinobacteria bacterium]|nr:MAG: integration host factor [Actinomycetota bacterium]